MICHYLICILTTPFCENVLMLNNVVAPFTQDVFTVSVGNLPPGASVLIKITYVAELVVEGENIVFSLPGSVAPWKQEAALDETTQTDVEKVKVKEQRYRHLCG